MREYEGEALLGRWLPSALADILTALLGMGGQKVDRQVIFSSWGLDWLAAGLAAQEETGRAGRMSALADEIEALGEAE